MAINNALISVGVPVRNGDDTLAASLNALLGQSYKNLEIIISDNESGDGTEKICKSYAVRDPRIKYFRQKTCIGVLENYKFVFQNSTGEYFMWAADDDWWHPDFVLRLKSALDQNPGYGVAMSSYARIYEDGREPKVIRFSGDLDITRDNYKKVFMKLASEWPIHHFLYGLFRREIMGKLLSRPAPFCKAWDRVFMCEAALATHFYSVPEVLWHKTTQSQSWQERYTSDLGARYVEPKRHSLYVWTTVWRLVTSPAIPLKRKLTVMPECIFFFVWLNRVFLREWAPNLFDSLLKFKKTWLW